MISVGSLERERNNLLNLRLLHDKRMERFIRRDPGGIAEGLGLGVRKI